MHLYNTPQYKTKKSQDAKDMHNVYVNKVKIKTGKAVFEEEKTLMLSDRRKAV